MMIFAVPGRVVRDPFTRQLVTNDGQSVDPTDPVWHRLLLDGDVSDEPTLEASAADAGDASVEV